MVSFATPKVKIFKLFGILHNLVFNTRFTVWLSCPRSLMSAYPICSNFPICIKGSREVEEYYVNRCFWNQKVIQLYHAVKKFRTLENTFQNHFLAYLKRTHLSICYRILWLVHSSIIFESVGNLVNHPHQFFISPRLKIGKNLLTSFSRKFLWTCAFHTSGYWRLMCTVSGLQEKLVSSQWFSHIEVLYFIRS